MSDPEPVLGWWDKQRVLEREFERWQPRVVVETGLWNGLGSTFQFIGRASVVVCDLDPWQCLLAERSGVDWAVAGDTRNTFPKVLERIAAPGLFWLDSHLVVEGGNSRDDSPLLEELAAIKAWRHGPASVLVIDDVRMMGRAGWPSLEQVVAFCEPVWQTTVHDDLVFCYPRDPVGGGDAMLETTFATTSEIPEAAPLHGPVGAH